MDGFQILILVPLDKYRTDYGCNKYKLHDVICANDYERNTDISNGISGYLWGVTPSLRYRGLEGNWAVVLATHDGYLMAVDKFYNIVKTRIGVVLHLGDIKSATQYLLDFIKDPQRYPDKSCSILTKDSVIGSRKWIEESTRGLG
jgi:hypothetical protein